LERHQIFVKGERDQSREIARYVVCLAPGVQGPHATAALFFFVRPKKINRLLNVRTGWNVQWRPPDRAVLRLGHVSEAISFVPDSGPDSALSGLAQSWPFKICKNAATF
jgi:hypothetical protein